MGLFVLKLLARLPFWFAYLLSRLLYITVYHLAGYRKKVVYNNLRNSFPEKSDEEIRQITKKFYRHFSELTVEVIKLATMKEADFRKRVVVKDTEMIDDFFYQRKSLVTLTMHYNNWEWSSCLSLFLRHKTIGVYKPLHNRKYDAYLNKNRSRVGAELIPTHQVLRRVLKAREQDETFFLWLAGDQTPPLYHKFWMKFLNQEALFYPGPAAISRRFNYPVIFQKITKTGRGRYEISFEVLVENPEKLTDAEIMKKYIRKMEETIREQPEYYLWSHKRWKHKRPEGIPLKN